MNGDGMSIPLLGQEAGLTWKGTSTKSLRGDPLMLLSWLDVSSRDVKGERRVNECMIYDDDL